MFENQYGYPELRICNPLDDSFGATDKDIAAYNQAYNEAVEMLSKRTGVPCDEEHKYGLVVEFVFLKSDTKSTCIACEGFGELMEAIRELDGVAGRNHRMQCFQNMFINMSKVVRIDTAVYLLDPENGEEQMLKKFFNATFGDTDGMDKNDPSLSYEMDRLTSVANMWWQKTNARPYTPEELERIEARKKAAEEARNARTQRILSAKCNPENRVPIMSMFDETNGRKAEVSPVTAPDTDTIPDAVCVEDDDDNEED